MKQIPLTQGKFAIVDDADFEWLNQWKWCASRGRRTFYVQRRSRANGKRSYMHHAIMGRRDIGHLDRDGLNNQRSNLRIETNAQRTYNKRKRLGPTSSIFKGVHRFEHRWRAQIRANG